MEPFTIRVLGGRFTVHEVIPPPGGSNAEAVENMRSVPAERWFVVLDESNDGAHRDALALIDDELQFQTLATGIFEGED